MTAVRYQTKNVQSSFLLPGSSQREVGQPAADVAAALSVRCVGARSPGGSPGCVFTDGGANRGRADCRSFLPEHEGQAGAGSRLHLLHSLQLRGLVVLLRAAC